MPENFSDWGDAIMTSLSTAFALFFAAIPRIVGFIAIIIIGWIVAALFRRALLSLLRALRFDHLSQRAGLSSFIQKGGVKTDASRTLANIASWFVRLITLVVAFDALSLPAVSDVLRQLVMWLPNLIVALVALVLGGLAANALSELVRSAASKGDLGNPTLLASVARGAVWFFAVVVAINQTGIAASLVNILFMGIIGALAIALGLAFGLGGRDTASALLRSWQLRQLSSGRLAQGVAANETMPLHGGASAVDERRSDIRDRRSPYARRSS
ncbi:small-conductance mechanosensitive ion channel [Oxalobacteraceae bacterium]|nr:small-conductance mechanosensitive ion channel [Oxalobacteraceae bacterium]